MKDEDARGIRYYEGAHFLIVYTDGKGGLKAGLKFLPDLTRKRSIDPYLRRAMGRDLLGSAQRTWADRIVKTAAAGA